MIHLLHKPARRRLVAAVLAFASLGAQAHRPWLLPSATLVDGAATTVTIDAAVSEDLFEADSFPLQLDGFQVIAPDGADVPTDARQDGKRRTSFDLKLPRQGTYRIAGVTDTVMASWKVDGETRRWRGAPASLAREVPQDAQELQVTRLLARAETFVTSGAPGALAPPMAGVGLELHPLTNPTDLSVGDASRFRLLLDGKPLPGADVTLIRGGNRYRYRMGEIALKTDAAGEFGVAWPEAGRYWMGVSQGAPQGGGRGASAPASTPGGGSVNRRTSYTATFEVLPK